MASSAVALANERISIEQALRWAEVSAWEGDTRKLHCPFGVVAHADFGMERSLRSYPDNTAYCFACARCWTPVRLMAEYWDCRQSEAAEKMLRMAGVTAPDWRESWEQAHQPPLPDTAALGEALKTWCRRVRGPEWEREQFRPEVSGPLAACLGVLPLVTTAAEADAWLSGCKLIMQGALEISSGQL